MTAIDDLQSAIGRVSERVAPSVVRIGRHGGRGCGVVVGDGLVLTNAHNLAGSPRWSPSPTGARSRAGRRVSTSIPTWWCCPWTPARHRP